MTCCTGWRAEAAARLPGCPGCPGLCGVCGLRGLCGKFTGEEPGGSVRYERILIFGLLVEADDVAVVV